MPITHHEKSKIKVDGEQGFREASYLGNAKGKFVDSPSF